MTLAGVASAAIPTTVPAPGASGNCVKGKYQGNATTYNPFKAGGWKTGGAPIATGGIYNPDDWAAALQLSLAEKHACGFGSRKVCHAVVEGNGKSLIVKINDNGPMCADRATAARARDCRDASGRVLPLARVIDLNEKSMRYMTNGQSGNNSGVIRNVTVTLLCDFNAKLGPLDEAARAEWANKSFGTPFSSTAFNPTGQSLLGGVTASPTSVGTPTGGTQSGYTQPANFSNYQQPSGTGQPTQYFNPQPVAQPVASAPTEPRPITEVQPTTVSAADMLLQMLQTPSPKTPSSTPFKMIIDAGKSVQLEKEKTKTQQVVTSIPPEYNFSPQTFTSPDLNPQMSSQVNRLSTPVFISFVAELNKLFDMLKRLVI